MGFWGLYLSFDTTTPHQTTPHQTTPHPREALNLTTHPLISKSRHPHDKSHRPFLLFLRYNKYKLI